MLSKIIKNRKSRTARSTVASYSGVRTRSGSRLAKKQQNQMLWQSLLFLGLAIALVLLFIFYILPNGVNLFFKFIDKGAEITTVKDELPPQTPIVSAPEEYISEEKLMVYGYAQPGNEVALVLNGNEEARSKVNDDGEFQFEIDLENGQNTIGFFAINESGTESNLSREYQVVFDNQAPDVKITSPEMNASFLGKDQQNIEIKGMSEPGAKIYVNGRLNFANSDGEFSAKHRLEEGENNIEIKAIDKAGNETISQLVVSFKL